MPSVALVDLVALLVTDNGNIAGIIDGPASDVPERAALVVGDEPPCSYGRLRSEVAAWAATLARQGVGPGDRVALADWGGVLSTAVTLAVAHLGAATAQMNPLLTAGEMARLATTAGCGPVAVGGDDARPALGEALGPGATVLGRPAPGGPPPPQVGAGGGPDVALILFTSGTTGAPKAVPISHAALRERIRAYRPPFDADRPPNVTMMCVPSFHVGGMLGLILSLHSGDTTIVQPRFDAGRWLELVARHRVSSAFVVPTMLARILAHPDRPTTDLSSLVSVSYGAAAAPVELVRRAMQAWPHARFANTFGQTETLGAYTSLTPDDHLDPARIGSVGRPLAGFEIRIVDPTGSTDVAPGETGEIWVRSSADLEAGWLRTGDLGRRDQDGYLYPVGRISDTINRGGEKFAPAEVAEALRAHPAVADVAVAGIADAEMGERVGAAVVIDGRAAAPSVGELREWCRTRLAPFKLPEIVVFVDALPYNELGKLPRRVAADLISQEAER